MGTMHNSDFSLLVKWRRLINNCWSNAGLFVNILLATKIPTTHSKIQRKINKLLQFLGDTKLCIEPDDHPMSQTKSISTKLKTYFLIVHLSIICNHNIASKYSSIEFWHLHHQYKFDQHIFQHYDLLRDLNILL